MRIAYVCRDPGVPVFGGKGCSVHVQEVTREFVRRGAQVDLFAQRVGGVSPFSHDVTLYPLPSIDASDPTERALGLWHANSAVQTVLHDHGPYDLIYERHALYSWGAMAYARQRKIPSVLEVNAPLLDEEERYRILACRSLAKQAAVDAMSDAAVVVGVSEEVARYVRSQRRRCGGVYVAPNGVDVARFDGARQARRSKGGDDLTIGFVGTLKPWHGVADLISAFAVIAKRRSAVRLLLVGDGPERPSLQARVDALTSSVAARVVFAGAVAPRHIPDALASMDVAVAPYGAQTEFYFSPLKLFEYMAAGLPIVASRVGQIAQVLDDETGVLYTAGDLSALARELELLCSDAPRRARLGAAARRRVAERHTWRVVVDEIVSHVLPNRSRPALRADMRQDWNEMETTR